MVEDWEEMIDVNLKDVLCGIAAALPVFRRQGFGHFVNTLSTPGVQIEVVSLDQAPSYRGLMAAPILRHDEETILTGPAPHSEVAVSASSLLPAAPFSPR